MTVTNDGPSTAENVVVYDYAQAGVVVTSVTPGAGCVVDTASGYVMCNLGTLASNAFKSITIQGMVDPAVPDGVFLINNAMVTSDNFDDDNSDNAAQSTTSVESTATSAWSS